MRGKKLTRAQKIYMTKLLGEGADVKSMVVIEDQMHTIVIKDRSTGQLYVVEKADL